MVLCHMVAALLAFVLVLVPELPLFIVGGTAMQNAIDATTNPELASFLFL